MAARINSHEVIPSARRLICSLRDVGYDFSSAVADLVDNSVEAGATAIDIRIEFDGDNSWVSIADNGKGMSSAQMIEAMRYGSARDYSPDDLGKFGLGLKTSSMSQCRFFAIASRNTPNKNKVDAYCWDMSHIERTDKWHILPLEDKKWKSIVSQPLKKGTGTVVLWRQLDRILGYEHPYGEYANKRLMSMCRDLEVHLAMVFHRFLNAEIPGKRKIEISINGNQIKAWDPFVRKEPKTQVLAPIKLKIKHEGISGEVLIQAFVLPHQQEFSSMEKFRHAGGLLNWNQQQGFYIYRSGRMIQSGGWCRLRTPDEHTKLARVALSFSPQLDEAFKINVAKMQVQLPTAYREAIDKAIQPAVKLARDTYDRKERRENAQSGHIPNRFSGNTSQSIPLSPFPVLTTPTESKEVSQFWTLDEIAEKLISICKPSEKSVINEVFDRLRKKLGVKT